jgi:hypothetical protein
MLLEHPPTMMANSSTAWRRANSSIPWSRSPATVIAAEGLISGSFSLASQAVALGLFPRLRIIHTHHGHEGQIYAARSSPRARE